MIDTKAVLDELRTTWAQMRDAVDTKADASTIQKMNDRLDHLETVLNRPMLGGPRYDVPGTPNKDHQLFFKMVSRGGPQNMASTTERTEAEALVTKIETKLGIGPAEKKALAIGDDTTGGFLAPPEFVQEIIKGTQLISPVRAYARIRPTNNRSVQIPNRAGVFAAKWVGESSTRDETQGLSYSMEEITPQEMYAEVVVSNQDLEDSAFDLAQDIAENASEQFAKAEGAAFVSGDGQKKPEGFLKDNQTAAANIAVDPMGTGGASALTADGIVSFVYNFKSAYIQGATLFMNRKTVGAVRLLKDSQQRYLWEPNYQAGSPPTILGIPYAEIPDMPDVAANNLPIALGNWRRGYMIVDRIDMSVLRLNELFAKQGQVGFLIRKRVGGQVILSDALRLLKVSVS